MSQPTISQQLTENVGNIGTNISEGTKAVGETFSNVRDNVVTNVNSFSENVSEYSTKEFLDSNGMVAKFVFLVLVLVVFLIILKLGISLISYFMAPAAAPILIAGINEGGSSQVISDDPAKGSQILRSNNKKSGMEFTWSVWLLINELPLENDTKNHHIFSKGGNGQYDASTGLMKVNNGPGLYLKRGDATTTTGKGTGKLNVVMNTASTTTTNVSSTYQTIEIDNIPLNRSWFNVMIRLQNKIMDVYVNGVITKRLTFTNVPLQNYDDIYVCGNGGFNGKLSSLRYWNYALNVFEINKVVSQGPNLAYNPGNNFVQNYLSTNWYTSAA